MVAYAYLRVSTDHQDLDNQRHGILEYANTHAINHLKFIKDKTSGRLKWRSRMAGELILETAKSGDIVIFAEISRNYVFCLMLCLLRKQKVFPSLELPPCSTWIMDQLPVAQFFKK